MNYKQYAQFLNANEEVIYWIEHNLQNYLSGHKPKQSEVEHIIDYLVSEEAPERLKKMSYKQAKANTKKWNDALKKKGKEIKEIEGDVEIVHDFKDDCRWLSEHYHERRKIFEENFEIIDNGE